MGVTDEPTKSSEKLVAQTLERSYDAMKKINEYDQTEVDELVQGIAWAICEDNRARELSELAVKETGFGNVPDKINKKKRKTRGTLQEILGEPSVGVINRDEDLGLTEYANPVGVVGAVVPSTNPSATATNLTMMSIKGRNGIVLSPSPSAQKVIDRLVEYIHAELRKLGAPTDLVQMIPGAVSKDKTHALMEQCDLLQVTGSANNVEYGQRSGTPNYCVGEGNAVSIIDSSADLEQAAENIMLSKTFDNATSCSSDNSVVIVDDIYEEALAQLEDAGGYLCETGERNRIEQALFPDGHGSLNGDLIARPVSELASAANIELDDNKETSFLMIKARGVGPQHPLSGEKLSLVLTVYRAEDIESAIKMTTNILDYEGAGHSCCLHTTIDEHIDRVGQSVPVCRVMINQPTCYGNGGNFNNGMPFTLSMGGGTWGGNQLDENLQYTHFINRTTVAEKIEPNEPDDDELFGSYFEKYGR